MLETVIVLSIIAVAAVMAVPRYVQSVHRYRAAVSAQRIVADLDFARRRARATSQPVVVQFEPASDTISIPGIPEPGRRHRDYSVELALAPYECDLVSADFGGAAKVTFDGFGRPDSGGDVVVRVGAATRRVTLDQETGRGAIE